MLYVSIGSGRRGRADDDEAKPMAHNSRRRFCHSCSNFKLRFNKEAYAGRVV